MAGTIEGGKVAAKKNKEKFGDDYYARIGAIGGKNGTTGGFAYSARRGLTTHIEAGRKGGLKSRRKTMPRYKTGDQMVVTKNGRKPRGWDKKYEIMDIFEHVPALPGTNYYGVKLKGRWVYALDGYQQHNGWLHEEEISTPKPSNYN